MTSGNSIGNAEGQKATEMMPPSPAAGHPGLFDRVQRIPTSGR